MNRFALFALAACVFAAGCGDDDSPAGPSNLPMVFSAILSPANEVPPVANAESSGRGAAQITITGTTVQFFWQLAGFPGNTVMIAAHIHPAVAGVNGPVLVNTGVLANPPTGLTNGMLEFSTTTTIDAVVAQQIAANPAAFYFNVHSLVNPGGFARGQLQRVQ